MTEQLSYAMRGLKDRLVAELKSHLHSFDKTVKTMLIEMREAVGTEKLRLAGSFWRFSSPPTRPCGFDAHEGHHEAFVHHAHPTFSI